MSNTLISLENGYLTRSTKVKINKAQKKEEYLHGERAAEHKVVILEQAASGHTLAQLLTQLPLLASPLQ